MACRIFLIVACRIFSCSTRTLSCSLWDLVPQLRIPSGAPCIGRCRVLATGLPGKSLSPNFWNKCHPNVLRSLPGPDLAVMTIMAVMAALVPFEHSQPARCCWTSPWWGAHDPQADLGSMPPAVSLNSGGVTSALHRCCEDPVRRSL